MTLAVVEALSHNKLNVDMTLVVAEVLGPNKPNPLHKYLHTTEVQCCIICTT